MLEYKIKNVTVLGEMSNINQQLKEHFDDGWNIHSWQYLHGTNHQIGVLLVRNVWDEPQVEEKPTRKFIGMKNNNAV